MAANRRLTTDILSLFRAVDKKGLRGFLEGGVFRLSNPLSCAVQCDTDPLCLSFDFETGTQDCYISHTDRYAHPEAFLDFPTGVYYEWQGVVDTPEIEPNGGLFNTQVMIRLLTAKLGAAIHYHIIPSTQLVTTNLTTTGLFGIGQNFSVAASGDVITLPTYSCKVFAIAVKEGMDDSVVVVSNEFKIFASKYAYLVPYFNSDFHGRVTRIELDLKGKKRPRPARFLEFMTHFAYFVPYMRVKQPDSEEVNPYSGLVARVDLRDFTSVQYLDLTVVDSGLRGFMRGFAYRQYVFLVPHRSQFFDPKGPTQSGKVARIDTNNFTPSGVSFLDLTTALRSQVPDFADSDLRGFNGGIVSGKYGFFVPYFNGATLSGKVCRINLDRFDEVQTLDLTQLDSKLRGYTDGILSKVQENLEANLFDEFQIRVGTTDPYDYTY
ncbi:hypothetical protein PC110_g4049 [Phytophthora cactorum]|uniref:Apple domain-containing protein n=2 Tax=Phytophthora cactorum TaxID=29920 RepID=A0A329SRY9_9STRA|nr:hypothetical protein PC110_g4049 [Phytophthora cactorum]